MTQQNHNQGEEAGNINSPSWEEIVEKEVTEVYPQDKFGDYAALAKSALEKGMNRAKDYYEKEVVEPLREEADEYSRNLKNAVDLGGKLIQEKISLQEENERLKMALEDIANWNAQSPYLTTCDDEKLRAKDALEKCDLLTTKK